MAARSSMLCRCTLANLKYCASVRRFSWQTHLRQSAALHHKLAPSKRKFPVLDGKVDTLSNEFQINKESSQTVHEAYEKTLKFACSGGGEKAIDRHVNRNKKMLATDRLGAMLDEGGDWLELGTLAGMGMEYGDIPRAGIISGKVGRQDPIFILLGYFSDLLLFRSLPIFPEKNPNFSFFFFFYQKC